MFNSCLFVTFNAGTASWALNIGNSRGEVLMSVLTASMLVLVKWQLKLDMSWQVYPHQKLYTGIYIPKFLTGIAVEGCAWKQWKCSLCGKAWLSELIFGTSLDVLDFIRRHLLQELALQYRRKSHSEGKITCLIYNVLTYSCLYRKVA